MFLPCLQDCLCLISQEPLGELLHCLGTVAYIVFHLFSEFGEALVVAVGDKDRVVAEALVAMLLVGYSAFYDSFETVLARAHWVAAFHLYERDDGAEPSLAVCVVTELAEQLPHVGLAVVVGAFGVACRVTPWLTVESVNLKPRVVGETVYVILVEYIFGLLVRVGLQRVASLRNVLMAPYVGK